MRRITKTGRGWTLPTILAATLILTAATPSFAFLLPDTGQTHCYRDVSPWDDILCSGTGQDGEYNINPLSYTMNDNGTVTDNNTGLMWQQQDDGVEYNWYRASGTHHATYNPESSDVCGALGLAGHSDWRLPTRKELESIVDFQASPAIRAVFTNTQSSLYWSSTTFAGDPNYAGIVRFDAGYVYSDDKNYNHYVRCVRGGQVTSPMLTDNGNGTVSDENSGLVWQQGEPGVKTWGAALSYCRDLQLAGESDWRLPNVKELESLVDDARWDPAIDTTKFPGAYASYYYWSSTTDIFYPNYAWLMLFGPDLTIAHKDDSYYVRCVRGGASLPTWRSGETDLGGGWKWTSWFGYYSTASEPWIYHQEHQWLYPYDDGSGGVFFWYDDMQKFVWTNPATYPYLYRFGDSPAWLWYQKDSANPRWFYNYAAGVWEQLP